MPLVSVVIPAYNCENFLAETLDSVLSQTYTDWECIVIDDGSVDGTFDIAESYASREPRIKCFHQENQGVSSTRNNGIRFSRGEYVMSLDSDDLLKPTFLEKTVGYLVRHQETKLVYCYAETFGTEHEILAFAPFRYHDFIWGNQIFNYAVYRRIDFDLTDGYNPNMVYGLEDWDFYLSLLKPGDTVHCIKEPLYYYRKRSGSRSETLVAHQESMAIQMCRNHPDVYLPYQEKIILFMSQLVDTQKQLNEKKQEIDKLKSIWVFRLFKRTGYLWSRIKKFFFGE